MSMTKNEWEGLETLGMLMSSKAASPIDERDYYALLDKSRDEEEHPEEYEGPCGCRLCCSYGD